MATPRHPQRSIPLGQRMEPGLKKGVPDMFLPVPTERYHGLCIELKVGGNNTSPEQNEWLHELAAQGYKTAVCWGWEAAWDAIEGYLRGTA